MLRKSYESIEQDMQSSKRKKSWQDNDDFYIQSRQYLTTWLNQSLMRDQIIYPFKKWIAVQQITFRLHRWNINWKFILELMRNWFSNWEIELSRFNTINFLIYKLILIRGRLQKMPFSQSLIERLNEGFLRCWLCFQSCTIFRQNFKNLAKIWKFNSSGLLLHQS